MANRFVVLVICVFMLNCCRSHTYGRSLFSYISFTIFYVVNILINFNACAIIFETRFFMNTYNAAYCVNPRMYISRIKMFVLPNTYFQKYN